MIKTDFIERNRKNETDYFKFIYTRTRNSKCLDELLNDINFDDYWCYKLTDKYKFIETIEELKEFKYSGYMFFNKKIYYFNLIEEWKSFLYELNIQPKFLSKPFPPEYVKNLIKII